MCGGRLRKYVARGGGGFVGNKKWWFRLDLNQRHKALQASALPTELQNHSGPTKIGRHELCFYYSILCGIMKE